MIKMATLIKANVKVSDKGIVVSAIRKDMQYWGQSKGTVVVEGMAVAYKTIRRVTDSGKATRMVIAEAGEINVW